MILFVVQIVHLWQQLRRRRIYFVDTLSAVGLATNFLSLCWLVRCLTYTVFSLMVLYVLSFSVFTMVFVVFLFLLLLVVLYLCNVSFLLGGGFYQDSCQIQYLGSGRTSLILDIDVLLLFSFLFLSCLEILDVSFLVLYLIPYIYSALVYSLIYWFQFCFSVKFFCEWKPWWI